jgi:molybdopterin synthase sulfur carrier subunit
MKVTIKLFASLREGRFEIESRNYWEGATVDTVRRSLRIPQKLATIIFVNGIHAAAEKKLHDGDTIAFFPPSGGG